MRAIRSTWKGGGSLGARRAEELGGPSALSPHCMTVGKKLGQPLWRLWGSIPSGPALVLHDRLDSPEKMRAKVREADDYPILKVKLGTPRRRNPAHGARATKKPLRVDANAGWTVARPNR